MIFKDVREGRPYPEHGLSMRDWARIPPRQIRMDELITTKRELRLDALLDEDSTFYGDLFGHAVLWEGQIYLEDGLHRALRAALQQRTVIHVRILNLDALRAGAGEVDSRPTRSPAKPPTSTRHGGRRPAADHRRSNATSSRSVRQPQRHAVGQQPAAQGQHGPSAGQPVGLQQSVVRCCRAPRLDRSGRAGPVSSPSTSRRRSRMSSSRRASASSTSRA